MLFLKAFLSGVLVSAPVGAGTLLIARLAITHDFLALTVLALGVGTADALMGAVASLGIKALDAYLPHHHPVIYVVMGLLLASFALYLWYTPFSKSKNTKKWGLWTYFFTGFSITALNPLTLAGLVALFSALNLSFQVSMAMHILLIASLFLGCCSWWFGLTLVIFNLTKNKGNHALKMINTSLAGVMGALGVYVFLRGVFGGC